MLGKRLCLFVCVALAGSASLSAAPSPFDFPGKGFATPEKVVEFVVDRIRNQDLAAVLGASAIAEQANGYDFSAFTKRIGAMTLMTQMAPAGSRLYDDVNRMQLAFQIARQVKFFTYSFNATEKTDGAPTILHMDDPEDAKRLDAFIGSVDPKKLAGLKIVKMARPGMELTNQRHKDNMAALAKLSGASEMSERVVLYSLGDRYFLGGFSLVRYGAAWKMGGMYSNLAGTSVMGSVEPSSPEEFAQSLAGLAGE
jgi:hypothetical protein